MPVTQDRLGRLREFGLSEYAGRAYLALLDLGIAEARDVSSLSKVPQAKIYHVLEQLHEKGLAVILPEFPKKYAPVPFQDYLDRLHAEHRNAADAIEQEREDLAQLFRVMGDADVGDRGFFTVLRGRRNVLSKMEEMVGDAKEDVLILGTTGTIARAGQLLPALQAARARGIQVRLKLPIEAASIPQLDRIAEAAEVRLRNLDEAVQSAKVAIVLVDGVQAFLIHFVPDDANLYQGKDIGVFTDQEAMVGAIRLVVEPHWARAPTYEARKLELTTGRAPEFTRVYTTPDEAWDAMTTAMRRGVHKLRAVNPHVARGAGSETRTLARRLHDAGASFHSIVNLPDAASCDEHEAIAEELAGTEVRHLMPRFALRQWIFDDREAFFSLVRKDGARPDAELVIHTNNPAVVASMRANFESLWASALPLELRKRELALFPSLQPGDIGIGLLFDIVEDALVVTTPEGTILLWNEGAAQVFGIEAAKARGMMVRALMKGEFHVDVERAIERSLTRVGRTEGRGILEGKIQRADGTAVDVEWTLSSIANPDHGVPLLLHHVRDVTHRRLAQEAELRSKERIVRVYESMTEAFYALDLDWRFLYTNPVTERLRIAAGAKQSYVGRIIWDAFPDLKGTRFETEFRRAMETMKPTKFEEHYARLGLWFEVNAYPSAEGLSVYYRDVSARKKAEDEVRLRNQQLADAERLADMGTWTWDPVRNEVVWSDQLCRIFGHEPGSTAATFEGYLSLVHEGDRARVRAALEAAMKQGDGFAFTERIVRPDGALRILESRGTVTRDAQDHPIRLQGVCQDVTDRREAELALRSEEQRFHWSFANAPVGMALTTLEGRFSMVNAALATMLGHPEASLKGRAFQDITFEEDLDKSRAHVAQLASGAATTVSMEKRYVHRSGRVIHARTTLSLIRDDAGRPVEVLAHVVELPQAVARKDLAAEPFPATDAPARDVTR